jgi:hypothetical protein
VDEETSKRPIAVPLAPSFIVVSLQHQRAQTIVLAAFFAFSPSIAASRFLTWMPAHAGELEEITTLASSRLPADIAISSPLAVVLEISAEFLRYIPALILPTILFWSAVLPLSSLPHTLSQLALYCLVVFITIVTVFVILTNIMTQLDPLAFLVTVTPSMCKASVAATL